MYCISLAILSQLSQFPSPAVGTNWLFCVDVPLNNQSINQSTNSTSALNSLHWLPIRQRIDYKLATIVHHSLHNACSQYLSSLLHTYTPTHQRNPQHVSFAPPPSIFSPNLVPTLLSTLVVFSILAPLFWNSLPLHLRSIDTYTAFKSNLNTHLFCFASISGP